MVQAYVFSEAGIVLTIIAYVIITIMIYTGVMMVIRVAETKGQFDSYSNIISSVLGTLKMLYSCSKMLHDVNCLL